MRPKNPTSREKQEHEDSGHVVYRSWCAACVEGRGVGGQHRIELLEEGARERTIPMVSFLRLLDTGECRHVSNSDLSRQQTWSKGSDMLWMERSHSIFHFISCRFHQRSWISQNHFEWREWIEYESFSGSDDSFMCWGGCGTMKRQCGILKICAELNTSVRITGDISLLNWIFHFPMRFLNIMRIGRRWRKPMAQFGGTVGFHKIGEEGITSFVKRISQRIFVGHHGLTRAILYITKSGIVRGKSRTKQTLSDACWEDLFDNLWHMVNTETRLTKKVVPDEEAGLLLPRIVVKKTLEVECRRFYVKNIEAHGRFGSCLGYAT